MVYVYIALNLWKRRLSGKTVIIHHEKMAIVLNFTEIKAAPEVKTEALI